MTNEKTEIKLHVSLYCISLICRYYVNLGKDVKDDPLSVKFKDIPYLPLHIAEKFLPSILQFLVICGVIVIAVTAMIFNRFW